MSETRMQILETAGNILIDSGYDALTTEEIAHRLEMSHSGVHYHFETKDDLLVAFVEYLSDDPGEKLTIDGPPEEQLVKLLELRIRGAKKIQHMGAPPPSLQLLAATSTGDDALRQALDRLYETYVAELTVSIKEGVETGVFETDEPEQTAWTLAGLIQGAEVRASHDGSPAPFVWGIETYVLPALYTDEPPALNSERGEV